MPQIQCSRCGFAYSAMGRGANACPSCGMPALPPSSSAPTITRPASGHSSEWRRATATAPTYSPYPAEDLTPSSSWEPDARTQPARDRAFAASPSSARTNSQSGASYGPGTARGGQRRRLTIIAAVAVAALILGVVGVLAASGLGKKAAISPTATVRATERPTAPALPTGYALYTDKSGLYAIGYPSDWSTTPVDDPRYSIILFAQSNLGATVEIERVSFGEAALTGATAQPLLVDVFKGYAQVLASGASVGNQSSVTQVKLAGNNWFEETADATYTVAGSQMTSHIVVDITGHDGAAIILVRIVSQGSDYDTLNTRYFTPMIATFRFLK